jgi:hypothetical protein
MTTTRHELMAPEGVEMVGVSKRTAGPGRNETAK